MPNPDDFFKDVPVTPQEQLEGLMLEQYLSQQDLADAATDAERLNAQAHLQDVEEVIAETEQTIQVAGWLDGLLERG
jgi:hypothetical protein